MQYIDDEKRAREAAEKFAAAFNKIENAAVYKSQKNTFGLYVKFPLFMFLLALLLTAVIILQVMLSLYDPIYIVCEVVIFVSSVFLYVVFIRTWLLTIKNAKLAEKITYYNGKKKCMVTEITGGGSKIEWADASLYMKGDDFELIESDKKEYNRFFYKKLHGHSRGFRLFDAETIVKAFFDGATVIPSDDTVVNDADKNNGEVIRLSSGFSYCIEYGSLKYFEIDGFYDECYENNFPIMSIKPQSKSYVFRYDFTAINTPNFRLVLPDRAAEGAKLFFVNLPDDNNIVVNS